MDPLANLNGEIHSHILFNLEPVEFLPVMQVSLLWYEVAANELERMIFLKYAPGEEREVFRSKYGVESAEHLFCRIKAFAESADRTKTTSLIVHFPFNPGLVVAVKIYPNTNYDDINEDVMEWGNKFLPKFLSDDLPFNLSPELAAMLEEAESAIPDTEEAAQAWIQRAIQEGLSLMKKTEAQVNVVVMKRLFIIENEATLKMKAKEGFFTHRPMYELYPDNSKMQQTETDTIAVFCSNQLLDGAVQYFNCIRPYFLGKGTSWMFGRLPDEWMSKED